MKRAKYIVLLNILFDTIGIGIVIPILPYYVREFGASAFVVTLLFAAFSFCMFLTSPMLGALSDKYGRRPIIILSIVGTSVGWFVFAAANSLTLLFAGRIIDGAAAGKISAAQSYLVDISSGEKERAENLGLIGAAFGVGFILGPIVGGALSEVSHSFPFVLAGFLSAANAILAIFFLPESLKEKHHHRPLTVNPLRPIGKAFRDAELKPLYWIQLLFGMAFVTVQSVFALFTAEVFGFTSLQTGMLFTISGIVVLLNQTVLLKMLWLRRFNEVDLIILMCVALGIGVALIATKSLILFYLSLLFHGAGQAVIRVAITSQVASIGDPARKGERLGTLASIISAAMVIAPILSGALFEVEPALPFIAAAVIMVAAYRFGIVYKRSRIKAMVAEP